MIEKYTIVIVDDEDIITTSISEYLELTTDYNILTYNNPNEALDAIRDINVDVMISDFLMPQMNGLDFLSKTKELCPNVIMILLTGYADKENAIRAINELELFQYIEKPWDNEALCMVIKNGLEKKDLISKLSEKVDELEESHDRIIQQNQEISHLYNMLKQDYQAELENVENVIVALAKAIEAKDKYTEGHTDRVSKLAVHLGEKMNLSPEKINILKIGGIVHDIGKIGVPEHILNKPGRLDPEEFELVKEHSVIGEQICRPLKSLQPVLTIIRSHHEKLNGSGYPDHLTCDQISEEAKIIAVADIYDAISTDRPYRKKMNTEEIISLMIDDKEKGNLDALIVDILVAMLRNNEIFL